MKLPFFFSAGILLLASLCCRAQFYRSWADGPLTRYDFQMPFPENAGNVKDAYISLSLIRENKVVKSQDIVYKYQDIMASIIPGQSWISPEARTEATLARLQKEFDVFQHFASRYRDDYLFYNDLRQDQYENYFPETNKHKLPESWYLEQYRLAVQEIGKTGDASPYPVSREAFDITKVPCRIEEGSTRVLFYLISVFPGSALRREFEPAYGLSGGVAHREGKGMFGTELSIAAVGPHNFGYDENGGSFDTKGAFLRFMAYYGRYLFSEGKMGVNVFAGAGYSAWKPGLIIADPLFAGATLTQGVNLEFPLKKTMNFLAKKPQLQILNLNVKLYVDELYNASEKIIMPTFNLAVGLDYGWHLITRP